MKQWNTIKKNRNKNATEWLDSKDEEISQKAEQKEKYRE